jgi:hypothetical protein
MLLLLLCFDVGCVVLCWILGQAGIHFVVLLPKMRAGAKILHVFHNLNKFSHIKYLESRFTMRIFNVYLLSQVFSIPDSVALDKSGISKSVPNNRTYSPKSAQ